MTPGVRRSVYIALVIVAAILLQSVVLSRAGALSGADLLLVVVIGFSMTLTTGRAALLGFTVGLLLDIVPPDLTTTGVTAFVLCLVAYLAASIPDPRGLAWWERAAALGALALLAWLTRNGLALLFGDRPFDGWHDVASLASYPLWTVVLGTLALPALMRIGRAEPRWQRRSRKRRSRGARVGSPG